MRPFGEIFLGVILGFILSTVEASTGAKQSSRRQSRHRWLSNGLKPRKMHWGPRRLF